MYYIIISSYQNKRVRFNDFAKTIYLKRIVENKSDAEDIATTVMNFFGYRDSMSDNLLNQKERNLFYMLEDENILFSQEEDYKLLNGKNWRAYYWILNKDEIFSTLEKNSRFISLIKKMEKDNLKEFKEVVKSIENGCNSKEELEYFYGENTNVYIKILKKYKIIEITKKDYISYDIINKKKLSALC